MTRASGAGYTSFSRTRGPAGWSKFMARISRKHPRIAHGYFMRQWFDEDAPAWAEQGIDAAHTLAWREGLLPPRRTAGAGRRDAGGADARVVGAGIPVDEVAACLGAGHGPAEAGARRPKGIAPNAPRDGS
jgi:hypothetical protein